MSKPAAPRNSLKKNLRASAAPLVKATSSRKRSSVPHSSTGSKTQKTSPNDEIPFPIVGIGASAGGLEALDQFLSHVPVNCGMAFVIIQHLDPTQKGMMPELLQRTTRMSVVQAKNGMKVKPNSVYVIPPNKDMSILHGTLLLLNPIAPRGLRLPIDFFLRALAEDQRDRSIGVILSGMGSDGTLGLRAIKEKAGLALCQEPGSSKFDSMPKSAIEAGLADFIANAQDLPAKIIEFVRHTPHVGIVNEPKSAAQKSALDKIFILLRSHTGHDFSQYKKSTIYRRVERRMGLHQLKRIGDYVHYLRENPKELDLLFNELLIGVTSFFRDPDAWAYLQEHVLPTLLANNLNGKVMRAWVAGCATGEEAYTLAIAFNEVLDRIKPQRKITLQIFATDLDADAIDKARQGYYPANIAADLSAERLARYFIEEGNGYRVNKVVREMVVFATQNVIMDPPFTKLEILTCRNLLIYLGSELQKKLFPLFHYCLNPNGILFLGSSENIGNFTELYTPLEAKVRLYRRKDSKVHPKDVEFPSRLFPVATATTKKSKVVLSKINLQSLADQLLLQHFSPAAVLVNGEGDILYISGRTGKYLEPAAGKANWNIHAMARNGLQHELAMILPKALRDKETITRSSIKIEVNGSTKLLNITVHAIEQPEALRGMAMIVFHDLATTKSVKSASGKQPPAHDQSAELEYALQQAHTEIQTVREEMQTQQEELKSTNEELQSTNEELQSTNEELTTSKEEMQSLNEELQTVNIELQSKVEDLSTVNNDLKNLLDSTDIATVFLDNAMYVRRFTNQSTKIFKLIPGDVGRPLSDIKTDLEYPELQADAQEVLRTLVFSVKEITANGGRWFKVKIMPYRTLDNVIDGVVITFTDISAAKKLEADLRSAIVKSSKSKP